MRYFYFFVFNLIKFVVYLRQVASLIPIPIIQISEFTELSEHSSLSAFPDKTAILRYRAGCAGAKAMH
jgi:hypothetical protein